MSIFNTLKFIINHPINKDNKLNSIIRFALWQMGSRLVTGDIVYNWVNGTKFLVRTGETGLTGNIYTGLHEFSDMAFLLHVLRPDDLFVDIGANVGSYTILASGARGAHCYAFEPIPKTYSRLIDNLSINHLENKVTSYNIGLGEKPGIISFTGEMDTMNHVISYQESTKNTIEVEVSTLDIILKDRQPAVIKIDVEGYETPVLEGALITLKKTSLHSIIMELNGSGNRYGYDENQILEMMLDHGFKTYTYNPMNRILINLKGKNISSGNTIFIREESLVLEKLRTSSKFKIHDKNI